ncbi:MAG: carbohydrate-binding module family 14 protein [Hyphomicrobium sp.]|nr:carbohydrate-binding module family 14 protein [Hyphomicrobium sp.]MBZ0209713.1 carbohydrate-binding module family 14 protein [Hyphomicrobium sp.]
MHKIIIALLAAVTLSAATLPAFAQSCPEGQHYDAVKKKCVPHGQ